jgi:hypothetical protein
MQKERNAGTIAAFLGISVGGLGAWVKHEVGEVQALTSQVNDLDKHIQQMKPTVDRATAELKNTSLQQLELIQSIVHDLVQENLAQVQGEIKKLQEKKEISGPYELYNDETGPRPLWPA